MPRNGSGVYSKPPNTTAQPNTTILSAMFNSVIDDLVADANNPRPVSAGGTGATSVAGVQASLSLDNKVVYLTKSTAYTAVATDNNAVIECTAAFTLALTAAASLGANWHAWVYANGGDVTVDPNAAELINGATTLRLAKGESAFIICTGSAFKAIVIQGAPPYAAKTGAYTAVDSDNGGVLRFTTAATLSLTAAATLGSGWRVKVIAYGVDVTIDPNASEQINGATTFILKSGQTADIVCDGSAFWADVHGDSLSGPQLQGYSTGLALTKNAADAANDVDIAVGAAAADTSPYYLMQLASALTKRIDASWAAGTNQGGLDTGAAGDNTYYIWLIQRSDTGVVDVLFSLSSTAPTMPTSYDRKRRLGSLVRASSVNAAPNKSVGIAPFAILQDQKANGTAGGSSVASAWTTRVLNTEVVDADNIVTLSSNQFTPTIDCMCTAMAPFFQSGNTRVRIWNVTDSVEVARSPSQAVGSSTNVCALITVVAKLLAGKTYRLEYYCTNAAASNGLSAAISDGGVEVYSQVYLQGLVA